MRSPSPWTPATRPSPTTPASVADFTGGVFGEFVAGVGSRLLHLCSPQSIAGRHKSQRVDAGARHLPLPARLVLSREFDKEPTV